MPPADGFARHLWLGAGVAAFAVGTVGIALPLLPTVPLYLLAAFCFARSRPDWEARLLNHPQYGRQLREWRERRAISRPAKLAAVGAMGVGVGVTWLIVGWPYVLISIAVLVVTGSWIWTRNE